MSTLMITGGCGFIGSGFLHMLARDAYKGQVVNMDMLTYAGNLKNIESIVGPLDLVDLGGDIADELDVEDAFQIYKPDYVVNFAAETHVDRSIVSAAPFVRSNVVGVQMLLDASMKYGVKRFCQISTDEVYGDLNPNDTPSKETDHLKPSSPYSATKAAADLLVLAYHRTHKMDVVITRCSNNFGPRQYPEKLIPLAIRKLMNGEKIPVYGNGENVRDWIYVDDHCRGIWNVLQNGKSGEIYNFGGGNQVRNIDLVKMLVKLMGKDESSIEFVTDRPGHDFRYDMDFSKATKELGWRPEKTFEEGLRETVAWYLQEYEKSQDGRSR